MTRTWTSMPDSISSNVSIIWLAWSTVLLTGTRICTRSTVLATPTTPPKTDTGLYIDSPPPFHSPQLTAQSMHPSHLPHISPVSSPTPTSARPTSATVLSLPALLP